MIILINIIFPTPPFKISKKEMFINVPAFQGKIKTTPVSYQLDDGTSGTLWFANNYGYLMVEYALNNPKAKSTIRYTLSSTKVGPTCFLQ